VIFVKIVKPNSYFVLNLLLILYAVSIPSLDKLGSTSKIILYFN